MWHAPWMKQLVCAPSLLLFNSKNTPWNSFLGGETAPFATASPPPWTWRAARRPPSGGSAASGFRRNVGQTWGFGWRLRGGGRARRCSPVPRSPAWWSGRAGGSRRAGSAGRLSAYWLEGCSAEGWRPESQRHRRYHPFLKPMQSRFVLFSFRQDSPWQTQGLLQPHLSFLEDVLQQWKVLWRQVSKTLDALPMRYWNQV